LEEEVNRACDFLNILADEVYGVAKKSGFHDKPVDLAVMLQNLAGEQAELWESYRKQTLNDLCDKADKMQEAGLEPLTSIEEEMADIVIRALDTAVEHRVDIGRAVRLKNAFNKTRAFRHGGKIA
jgi:NTP pyrophosphatase (non-canonical NTP hydrolase)